MTVLVSQSSQSRDILVQRAWNNLHVKNESRPNGERIGASVVEDSLRNRRTRIDHSVEEVLDKEMQRENERQVVLEPIQATR